MVVCTFIDVHAFPEEVLLHVLYFLPPKDLLLNCATVSKYFQELAYNERLWWHHVFLENKHYSQEWLSNTQTAIDPYTPMTPITPLSARTPISSSSTSSARIVWRRDRYVYHVGLDERFDRIYSHYDNDNDTHVLNPRHYYIESCLVQASSRENDNARDGETDVTPASKGYKTNGGANGFLDRNKAIENKIAKGLKTPGKRHRLTLTSVLTPVNNTPNTPTTPSSPTTPQSPVLWLNNLFTNTVNNIRYGKPPANVSHRSICLIGGFSERIQDDSQREPGVHMFDCARQQFRAPIEQFIKNEKPTLYGKHSAVLFDEDETRGIQGRIFLFGGSDGTTVTDDLFIYDLDRSTFIRADIRGPKPAPRVNHCACRIGDYHMYVLGGGVGKDMVPSSEIWVLDTRTLTWELLEQANNDVFTPRLGFTIAAINDKILLHGGAYWIQNKTEARWREAYKQTMLFDTKTRWWTLLRTSGSTPEVGSFPTSCLIGTQWFFISGATESNVTEEIYCFDTVTYKWRHMKEKNYLADGLACCPYTHYGPNRQQKILIFGGYRYAPLMSVSVLNVKWVDLMVKNGIMPLKQVQQGVCVPGVATPIDQPMDHSSMFAYY